MFTLGNKEAIVNDLSHYPMTTTDGKATDSLLTIKGFGTFEADKVVDAAVIRQEFYPESFGQAVLTVPSADEIGLVAGTVRNPVTFLLRINTSRYASEWATDFIRRGRPFVFELSVDGEELASSIATKLVALFEQYQLKYFTTDYQSGSLPFDWTGPAGADITMTLKAGHLAFQEVTTWMRKEESFGLEVDLANVDSGTTITAVTGTVTAGTAIPVTGDTDIFTLGQTIVVDGSSYTIVGIVQDTSITLAEDITLTATNAILFPFAGSEANVDGKYLEENVTMSTQYTDGAYAISPGERPVIDAPYVSVSWEMSASTDGDDFGWQGHKRLQTFAVDAETGPQVMKFTMYFNSDAYGTIAVPTGGSGLEQLTTWLNLA